MIIYEVRFQPEPNVMAKSAYFSSQAKAYKFVLANLGEMVMGEVERHHIPKTKTQILKFLNRHNGLG